MRSEQISDYEVWKVLKRKVANTVGRNGRKSLLEVKPLHSLLHMSQARNTLTCASWKPHGFRYMLRMLNQSPASDSE